MFFSTYLYPYKRYKLRLSKCHAYLTVSKKAMNIWICHVIIKNRMCFQCSVNRELLMNKRIYHTTWYISTSISNLITKYVPNHLTRFRKNILVCIKRLSKIYLLVPGAEGSPWYQVPSREGSSKQCILFSYHLYLNLVLRRYFIRICAVS